MNFADDSVSDSVIWSDEVLNKGRCFEWGIHGLVGHGKAPSESCCQFRKLKGCLGRNGSHDKVDVYGHNFHGKMAAQRIFMRCYSPRCSSCFRKGWAKREAENAEGRLLAVSKVWVGGTWYCFSTVKRL